MAHALQSILLSVVFAALAAGAYRWFRRGDKNVRRDTLFVFLALAFVVALRLLAIGQ